jgi:transglutaminase-like putative cysteine protease
LKFLQQQKSTKICLLIVFCLSLTVKLSAQGANHQSLPPGDKPPPTVFSRIADAGDSEKYEDVDHLVVYDLAVNRVKENGVTEVNGYNLYKILNEKGCKNMSVLIWSYDPQSSWVRVDEVNIIRNSIRIPVNISEIIDVPAPQGAIYWNNRQKSLQLPRLKVNDGIEVKTFRKGFTYALLENDPPSDENYIPPTPGEYFDVVHFESSIPIVEKKYVLMFPKSKRLHSQVYNGTLYSSTSYTADSTIYAWWDFDIPAREHERYSPGSTDIITKVVMSSAENWEAKSRWFYEINENQFQVTPAIKTKVLEIFKEAGVTKGSEEQKAAALLHWVAQNIRYSGQTMGKGEGFTLHSGEMVLRQRSGVCKDIASMLVTMMRAADMDSYAAMTMAGSRVEDLPADQFNHSVVALMKSDGRFEMYDPTWAPFNHDIWSKLETEQHYVVGTPEGEDLSRIAYSPPEESPLYVTSTVEIDAEGNLKGVLKMRASGAMDSRLRRMFTGNKPTEQINYLAEILKPVSERVEGISYKHFDPLDFSEGMWWEIQYRIPEYALPVGDGLEFKSPMMQIVMRNRLLLRPGDYKWEEERNDDVFLYYTQLLEGEENIKLPKGLKLVEPDKCKSVDETYAYFDGGFEMLKNLLLINQKIEIRRRQIPSDGYEGFRDAINGAMGYADTVFRVEKGGDK